MIYETMILTDDGRTLIFPNREVSAQVMENYSTHGWRRAQVSFYTAASSDVVATRTAIESMLTKYNHLHEAYVQATPEEEAKKGAAGGGAASSGLEHTPSNMAMINHVLRRSTKRNGVLGKVLRVLDQGEKGEALAAVSHDVVRQLRVLWDREQSFAKPSPPSLAFIGFTPRGYYHWKVFVWTRAAEHDGLSVAVAEDVAKTLQESNIKSASQVLERLPLPLHITSTAADIE